jgi:hypothetical protein
VEVGAQREWAGDLVVGVRAFRQRVDDQLVTLFGGAAPGKAAASIGHYYVATGGDFDARGWTVGVSRFVTDGLRASIDYTAVESEWQGRSADSRGARRGSRDTAARRPRPIPRLDDLD